MTSKFDSNNEQPCQVCGVGLSAGPVVYCSKCKTPHHKDCWDYLGQCSTFACQSGVCSSKAEKHSIQISADAGLKIDDGGSLWLKDKKLQSQFLTKKQKRRKSKKNKGRKRYQKIVKKAQPCESNRFTGHSICASVPLRKNSERFQTIDTSSTMESGLVLVSIVFLIFSNIHRSSLDIGNPYGGTVAQIMLLVSAGCAILRLLLSHTYVLDRDKRQLLYSRRFWRFSSIWKVCDFKEIEILGISHFHYEDRKAWFFKNSSDNYTGLMVVKGGHQIKICDSSKSISKANREVSRVSKIVGVRFKAVRSGEGTLPYLLNISTPPLTPIEDERQLNFLGALLSDSVSFLSVVMFSIALLSSMLLTSLFMKYWQTRHIVNALKTL